MIALASCNFSVIAFHFCGGFLHVGMFSGRVSHLQSLRTFKIIYMKLMKTPQIIQ